MPNWCDNWLHVSGEKNEIDRFVETGMKDGIWRLSHYLPMPDELKDSVSPSPDREELVARYGASNWYDWNMRNYGCKWDCETEVVQRNADGTEADLGFDSPWSPPIEFLKNVQRMFPKLDFRLAYMEIGNWFAGVAETQRDDEGAFIGITDSDPEYWDENDVKIDDTDDEAFNEYKREHRVRLVNPYEPQMYFDCDPDD